MSGKDQKSQILKKQEGKVAEAIGPYAKEFRDEITGMEFVWVPGGSFEMGDTFKEGEPRELPVHRVTLEGFYLGKYEVTQGEWLKIMDKNPSEFQMGDRYPVEDMNWNVVQQFLEKLNTASSRQYRLPSEAQWEYAAREGGRKVRFGTGKDTIGPDEANFNGREQNVESYSRIGADREETIPVESFSPNALGLYQMSGNIDEWCQDIWHNDYTGAPADGSAWETEGVDTLRVVRGGCWYGFPRWVRATSRDWAGAGNRSGILGFRLSLPVHQQ